MDGEMNIYKINYMADIDQPMTAVVIAESKEQAELLLSEDYIAFIELIGFTIKDVEPYVVCIESW